ncbi:hypothetical protein HYH03_002666 [Edaphochlamys debaryana]|uniref:Uncharacterized protein n=1 Tax=Edaphochlamys debaryana TaxID=47281 RepID=A0A835YEH1_9CHLO|nr:hypothetical protein HYH03_002666 [Edaphochlamys debaryana]|eukprot:KAG2499733.1 hypothetical protein HYH03_002666 [Edaphochlamys debaryana]
MADDLKSGLSAAASGDDTSATERVPTWRERMAERWATQIQPFIIKNYLPLAFLVALVFALAYPVPGAFLAHVTILGNVHPIQVVPMMLVFLISGLQLNTAELQRVLTLRNAVGAAYGFVSILLITPCLGFALREAPLNPPEFATGLAIFCTAPTTLGVGVALTAACGGNEALALLLTVGTNALGVVTMPPELRLLLPHGVGGPSSAEDGSDSVGDINLTDLLAKLAVTVLAPFTLGKILRESWPAALQFAKTNKVRLSLFSTTCLAFVIWQTLSSARNTLIAQSAGAVFAMIGLAIAQHLCYLLVNHIIVWYVLRLPITEAVAVTIMSSQKSAPVAVTAITFLTRDPSQQGLLSLPGIVGQIAQIFIGSAIAKYVSRRVKIHQAALAKAAAEAAAKAEEALEEGRALEAAAEAAAAAGAGADAEAAGVAGGDGGKASGGSPQRASGDKAVESASPASHPAQALEVALVGVGADWGSAAHEGSPTSAGASASAGGLDRRTGRQAGGVGSLGQAQTDGADGGLGSSAVRVAPGMPGGPQPPAS